VRRFVPGCSAGIHHAPPRLRGQGGGCEAGGFALQYQPAIGHQRMVVQAGPRRKEQQLGQQIVHLNFSSLQANPGLRERERVKFRHCAGR